LRQVVWKRHGTQDEVPDTGRRQTARSKVRPKTGAYSKINISVPLWVSSFPDPELTILVAIDEPTAKSYYGGSGGPAFREIARQVLPLLNVPCSAENPETLSAGGKR
jgi:hypothetical protein